MLIPKDTLGGHSISRTLRFSREGTQQPVLQFIEGTRLGNLHWNRLASIDLQNCFASREQADLLQLTMETDASGMLNSSITWLAGNKQLSIPPLGSEWPREKSQRKKVYFFIRLLAMSPH